MEQFTGAQRNILGKPDISPSVRSMPVSFRKFSIPIPNPAGAISDHHDFVRLLRSDIAEVGGQHLEAVVCWTHRSLVVAGSNTTTVDRNGEALSFAKLTTLARADLPIRPAQKF